MVDGQDLRPVLATSSGAPLDDLLDLLWSLWAELGVASVIRRHEGIFVDLEPLLIVTALLSDREPRLRDEAIDWVIKYGHYVSKARLKNLLADRGASDDPAYTRFAATVNAHARLGWPDGDARPIDFRPRARPLLKDLTAPSLIALRLRAIFGVGARAEIIRAFLARPDAAMTAAELASETSYRKRNVLDSVETLRAAGLVSGFIAGNATRYRLVRRGEVESIAGTLPSDFPRWSTILFELHALVRAVARSRGLSKLERAVTAHRLLEERSDLLRASGMYPPPLPTGTPAGEVLERWVREQTRHFARAAG